MPGVFKLVRRRYRDAPVPANGKHKRLVIVESPAKARTIKGYLGDDFVVESSVGHIRDLPQSAADIPAKLKKEPWARLGVDVENDFEPLYILDADKKKTVDMLKKRVAEADEVLLATDEDREGEAIAWHLLEVLKPKVPVRRMVFHEITADAIRRALDETRGIDERGALGLAERLEGVPFRVRSVESKPYSRRPSAPFMTSTLQQEASRKLRFTAQTTMRVAQRLYENGYITYMRTDSTTLSDSALSAARAQARELYGAEYVPDAPRRYDRKVKNAQEAHEAIRPAGDAFRTPKQLAGELNRDELALYELIWIRTIASQMKDAAGQTVSIRIAGTSSAGELAEFGASGTVITFRGFLAAYEESRDTDERAVESEDDERRLPNVSEGDAVELEKL